MAFTKKKTISLLLHDILKNGNEDKVDDIISVLHNDKVFDKLAYEIIGTAIQVYKNTPQEVCDLDAMVERFADELCNIRVKYRPAARFINILQVGRVKMPHILAYTMFSGLPISHEETDWGFAFFLNGLRIDFVLLTRQVSYTRIDNII